MLREEQLVISEITYRQEILSGRLKLYLYIYAYLIVYIKKAKKILECKLMPAHES